VAFERSSMTSPLSWVAALAGRLGEPVVRAALRQAMRIMGHQFVMGRDIEEALRRAATRPVYLSEDEFGWVYRLDTDSPPAADVVLQVDGWTVTQQVEALAELWQEA